MSVHAPTTRQLEVAAAVRLHGSPAAAATQLGISRQTVETTLARYHLDVCDARIDELQHEVERSSSWPTWRGWLATWHAPPQPSGRARHRSRTAGSPMAAPT